MNPEILQFLGRLHPMLVHFPIALISVAFLAEFLAVVRGREPSITAYFLVSLGALAALVAAGAGWLNAAHEMPIQSLAETLAYHRWLGVGLASATLLCWIFMTIQRASRDAFTRAVSRGLLLAAALLVGPVGHLGGTLVYGEGYLTEVFATPPAPATAGTQQASDEETELYKSKIQPIFEASCVECHGASKKKGNLRLDDLSQAFAGDSADWVIQPGNAAASHLVKLIELPDWDPDHMPEGDDSLPVEQIALIRLWIDRGAHYAPNIQTR